MLYFSPLEQFEIFFISHVEILFGIKLFITNYLLEMVCISLFTVVFFLAASNFVNGFLIPNVYLFSLESLYNFIYSIILFMTSLLPFFVKLVNFIYLITAIILGVVFLHYSISLFRDFQNKQAKKLFFYSIFYLFAIFLILDF